MLYVTLIAATLFACGSDNSNGGNASEASKVELSFNLPEKGVEQLTNATGSLSESYGFSCLTFKGDNGELKVYISSLNLKEQEYLVNVDDLSSPDILNSYTINSNGETSNCCGKINEVVSKGNITITSIGEEMISGSIDVVNYDGSTMKGSFSFAK
jgi:hypothetical protein